MEVPDWLPPSSIHNTEYAIYLKISYELHCQVIPAIKSDQSLEGFKFKKDIYLHG